MNVKINKRLVNMAIISFAIALILTAFAYSAIKKAAQPEKTERIAYFKKSLERDTVIQESDLELKDTPVSLIPVNAIKDITVVKDKRVTTNVTAGDFALSNNFISRGDIQIDVDEMWTIGIDIDNISNFIGVQFKEGEYYGLVFVDTDNNAYVVNKVKLVNIVDSTGKTITETGTALPKTINIAVNTIEEMMVIAEMKRKGAFEVVRPEEGWEYTQKDVIQEDYIIDPEQNLEEQGGNE